MSLDDKGAVDALIRMAGGFAATQMLVAAAELRIADRLSTGPRFAHEIAAEIGISPTGLYRFMRMLVVLGLLYQASDDRFELQPMGEVLRSDHPQSQLDRVLYIGEVGYKAALGTLHAVKTETPAFDHVFGKSFFGFFAEVPAVGDIFNRMMEQAIRHRIEAVVSIFDFSAAKTIVDVGGGNGTLLKAILLKNPAAQGVLFDMPKVIAAAQESLRETPLSSRIQTVVGDFFVDPIPSGSSVYILSNIIHDWDDERSASILQNCASAMRTGSELLVVADVMPIRPEEAPATVATDFSMMMLTGGRERTEREYEALFRRASLVLDRVMPIVPVAGSGGRGFSSAILVARKTAA